MSSAGYPNGRQLTDDIVDHVVEIITQGKTKNDIAAFQMDDQLRNKPENE
jgi:hypothetical protein